MRILGVMALLALTACQDSTNRSTEMLDDFRQVKELQWNGDKPYPFTTDGHIACSMGEVYFYPDDTANDESQTATPLNPTAKYAL